MPPTVTTGTVAGGVLVCGLDTPGSVTGGVVTAGSVITGVETEGSVIAGVETEGSETTGVETAGSETDGILMLGVVIAGIVTLGVVTAGVVTAGVVAAEVVTAGLVPVEIVAAGFDACTGVRATSTGIAGPCAPSPRPVAGGVTPPVTAGVESAGGAVAVAVECAIAKPRAAVRGDRRSPIRRLAMSVWASVILARGKSGDSGRAVPGIAMLA